MSITDNPALNHPEIMRYLLDKKPANQERLGEALERAIRLGEWLPSAKARADSADTPRRI